MLGAAHVRRTRRGKAPSGLQVQGGALVAPAAAKHPWQDIPKPVACFGNKLLCEVLDSLSQPAFCEVTARGWNEPRLGWFALLKGQNLSIYTDSRSKQAPAGGRFLKGRAWDDLLLGNRWVLLLIAYVVPIVSLWPFGRPVSGIPSWGLAAVDGSTAFALPADLLSAAAERRQRAPRGQAPGPRRTAKGLRPVVSNSNPPPCLSWVVRSTIVSA